MWKDLDGHERSSTGMGGTGESHDNNGFLGLGIPMSLIFLPSPPPLTYRTNSAGSRDIRREVDCRGVERVGMGTRERSNLGVGSWKASKCGWRSNSVANYRDGRRGFVDVVRWNTVLIGGGIRKDEGVKYLELGMKEDESAPPRGVEKSATQTISARLLAGSLNPGGGAKPSFFGGGLLSGGMGDYCCGGCWHIPPCFNLQPRQRRDEKFVGSILSLRWTMLCPGVVGMELVSVPKP